MSSDARICSLAAGYLAKNSSRKGWGSLRSSYDWIADSFGERSLTSERRSSICIGRKTGYR